MENMNGIDRYESLSLQVVGKSVTKLIYLYIFPWSVFGRFDLWDC